MLGLYGSKPGTGNIHIAGTPAIKVTPPAGPGKSAMIELVFRQFPTVPPLFRITCKCDNAPGGPITSTSEQGNMMIRMLPAFPMELKFEAKEGEQTLIEHGKPGGDLYVRVSVKQIKDD